MGAGVSALRYNTTGDFNTSVGTNSLFNSTTGSYNSALGEYALSNNTTGSNNTGIGNNAQVPSAVGNNQVRIGDTFISYAGIQVAWSYTSDKRLKAGITKSDLGLEFINNLNPVSYVRINDESKKTEYGFIAQEVEKTLANAGTANTGILTIDDEGIYSMRYNDLMAPMVKAIQEQQEIIERQQLKNDQLQDEVNLLKENEKITLARLKVIEEKLK